MPPRKTQVLEAQYHAGGGKLAGAVHAKLEELGRGAVIERRFRLDERLERVELERARGQYIYADGDDFYSIHLNYHCWLAVAEYQQQKSPALFRARAFPF